MNDDPGNLMIISAQEHMKLHPRIHAPHTQETKDAISRAHKGNTYHLGHHHSGNTKRVIGQGVSKASEDAWALRRQLYGPSGMRPRVSNQEGR